VVAVVVRSHGTHELGMSVFRTDLWSDRHDEPELTGSAPAPQTSAKIPSRRAGPATSVGLILKKSEANADAVASPAGGLGTLRRLRGVLRTVRPHQWVKNVFVLAPIVFAKEMFSPFVVTRAASAFAVFCLLAGAVYAMNDIADRDADRVHPVKRNRPIASGLVPVSWAYALSAGLVLVSLGWSLSLGLSFALVALVYFGQNVWYSFQLKQVAYLDVSCIAAGFVLRVMGGGYATDIQISKYLLACTALLALFLGFGKRRHELAAAEANAAAQRAALEAYTRRGLDVALALTALATTAAYLAYTLNPHTRAFFHSDYLWLSTGFVVLGVLRFLHIVKNRPLAESPTQEMLHDGPFVGIVLGWVVLVMWLVYHLRPT
jgi:decaprenyl-phosphate phosphoribosyltransferase